MLIDAHQHVWTRSLVDALSERSAPPRVTYVADGALLSSAAEPPHLIDLDAEAPARRSALVEMDGLDLALVAISSPIGIEALPRDEAISLIHAQLTGVASLGDRFRSWGPIPLDRPEPGDVDQVLERGCVGVSMPAVPFAHPERLAALGPTLDRIAERGVPLFVHPGPASHQSLNDPSWWAPLTSYVSQMQAAWLTLTAYGRPAYPDLVIVFAMLAGGAPLLAERLSARGGPVIDLRDPRIFYDTSSFGATAIDAMATQVGADRLVYGSDRPVIEPRADLWAGQLQENAGRLLEDAVVHATLECPA